MANNYQSIINSIGEKNLKQAYLVHGSEPFYADSFVQKIIDVAIPDFEKSFNEYILYGKDVSIGDVLNYARKFPMMADKQLVVVREAHLLSDLTNKDSLSLLETFVKSNQTSTILVLSFGKPQDERKTWVKAFNQNGQILNFKKLYDNEVPEFILSLCANKQLKVSPKAVQLLNEHIGNNLQAIANEIDKLKVNLKESEGIDANAIERYVGISKDYNVFELQKAILDRNAEKCYAIVKYFGDNQKENPIQPNIINLYNYFSKILICHAHKSTNDSELARIIGVNPYFLKDFKKGMSIYPIGQLMKIIHTLKVTDIKSKGIEAGSLTDKDLYNDMIYNILH